MALEPTRSGVIESFRPISTLLEEVVRTAQDASSEEKIRRAHPLVERYAHRSRAMGLVRWMVAADQLAARLVEAPDGFGCLTTDADHNQGKYAFSFPGHPGGAFMIRRAPHEPGEGVYVQERLEGVVEQAPLAEQFKHSTLKVYLSIPPSGTALLIAEHPAWPEPVRIPLSELRTVAPIVPAPARPVVMPRVRSTKQTAKRPAEAGNTNDVDR